MRKLSGQELTIKIIGEGSATELPKSEIVIDGASTGKIVSGAILEAAVSWNNFHLLFITNDILQEEMLGIYFFDRKLDLVDSAASGVMYISGSFSSLTLTQPNTIDFRFIGDTSWRVELFIVVCCIRRLNPQPTAAFRFGKADVNLKLAGAFAAASNAKLNSSF